MELSQLETFLAVAEERSFSRAAARVNEPSSQTAITARICRNATPATRLSPTTKSDHYKN